MKTTFKSLPNGKALPFTPTATPTKVIRSNHENLLPEINLKPQELPSKGLAYPKGCEITYRPYTFGEIQKINQSKLNHKQKISFVMDGITASFDKELMTVSDIAYIALLRKISTIGGHKAKISFRCKKCFGQCSEMLDFGTSNSPIEFHDIQAPELPVILTFSNNKEYSFSPLNFKSFVKIMEAESDGDTVALIAHQCVDADYKEIYKVIENSAYEDQVLLEELDKLLEHNIKPVSFFCKNQVNEQVCNHENEIELSGGEALLLPFRESEKSTRSKIRFGSKASH